MNKIDFLVFLYFVIIINLKIIVMKIIRIIFEYFLNSFREKGIIKFLGENIDNWSYPELDETKRIARIIKERLN